MKTMITSVQSAMKTATITTDARKNKEIMMTPPKLRRLTLPLLALLATSGAALAQPFTAALLGHRMAQQLATELPQHVVEKPSLAKPSLAKSGQGDDEVWFYFGGDEEDGDEDDDDDGDDGRGAQVNCALILGETAQRDCKARLGQSAAPPANGLFTPGTAPQAQSN